jgi:hypothetical protein
MFKKGILVLLIAMNTISMQASSAMAGEYYDYIKIIQLVIGEKQAEVNSEPTIMEQAAYIKAGRALVPLRFVGESLGAQVSWDNSKKQAVLNLTGTVVTVPVGSRTAYVDGKPTALDVPAEINGARAFIPLRFISESFGADVDYNENTKTVRVLNVDQTNWKEHLGPKSGRRYKCPTNWSTTTEGDGSVDVFTSPKGSKLEVVSLNNTAKPEKLYNKLKGANRRNGWTLEVDAPYDKEDLNKGFRLEFLVSDVSKNGYERRIFIYEPGCMATMIMDNSHTDIERTVMLKIAFKQKSAI